MEASNTHSTSSFSTLKEAGETIADERQDIRGREVVASDGDKVGKVDALLIDDNERQVRFFRVAAGGFLGIGEKKWLVPVDAIVRVDEDQVQIDQTRDRVVSAPVYDPDVIDQPSDDYYNGLYGYYGRAPYWQPGYLYPLWW